MTTVKDLKRAIGGLPDEANLFVAVIDDVYSPVSGFVRMYKWEDSDGNEIISDVEETNKDRKECGEHPVEPNCLVIYHLGG